ncbi:dihydroxyacetone kinase subunit DhaL [Serratia microhaemolytica]|uniref:dihydroxyacetone kinase subunit DhaL n=1 Tax=Serratia microhaemolytica TaxID=2675110 RepID=UPI000FDE5DC2|nr:dihydroxyacetone kinase subunit DhaL [Serratia microhaemolytica]
MLIDKSDILAWLSQCATTYAEQMHFLTELDRDIGDADHGVNMHRGFQHVAALLPAIERHDIGTLFKNTGMTLFSSVGGASGPLYGTFFVCAASAAGARTSLTLKDLLDAMSVGIDGVVARGKAALGDKTLCDVWLPVLETAKQALSDGIEPMQILALIESSAEQCVINTIMMQAKKGRASYLGERSIGHQDPGATSSMLMLKTLHHTIRKRVSGTP